MEESIVSNFQELPENLWSNLLTADGEWYSDDKRLFVKRVGGMGYIWGVFDTPLKPQQIGEMTFSNVRGTLPISASFGEWSAQGNKPHLGSAHYNLVSVQRGTNVARIRGLNTYGASLVSAAGLIAFIE